MHLPKAREGSLFVGAGDSYGAAMAVFYLSGAKQVAVDPYVLASVPEIAAGREVFFISVSGKTSSNVIAARRTHGIALKRTTITANEQSPLVKATDDIVPIPYRLVPRTPGTLSFTLSLLASLRIALGRIDSDYISAFEQAKSDAGRIAFARGTTYFLGNGPAHSAAFYASAKVYEFLGASSHSELLEEFSHMELFSLAKNDVVNIFSAFDSLRIGAKLQKSLAHKGFASSLIPSNGRTGTDQLFHSIFLTQFAVIEKAKLKGLQKPAFLVSKGRLEVSDALIY